MAPSSLRARAAARRLSGGPDRSPRRTGRGRARPHVAGVEHANGRTMENTARSHDRVFARLTYGDAFAKVALPRPGAARSRPVGGAAAGDSLGQQRRAPAAGARGAARRHALRADFAGLFAGLHRLRRAQARPRAAVAGTRVRRRIARVSRGHSTRRWRPMSKSCTRVRPVTLVAPRHGNVRGAALDDPDDRGRSPPRGDRARRCRQDPLHVGLDGDAEGRHQYAPHDLQQPADDPADAALPRRRAAGARRLAALASHLRRQPQRRHRGLQRRVALSRRRAPDAGRLRRERAQPARGGADDLPQRAERLRRAGAGVRQRPDAGRDVLRPRAGPLLCRRRPVAARRRRAAGDRHRDLRRASRPRHRPRLDRDRADGHLPAVGERAVVSHRSAGAGRRGQAGSGRPRPRPRPGARTRRATSRSEARDPRARAERDAGLLAAGRPDARGVRRRGLLLHGRRRAASSIRGTSRRGSSSTAASRRTSSCRQAPGSASARCARGSSRTSRPTCATR